MIFEVSGFLRRTICRQVVRRRCNNTAYVEQFTCNQRRVLQVTNSEREIEVFFEQVDAPIVEIEIKFDFRVLLAERRDWLAHVAHAERQRHGKTQHTAEFAMLMLYPCLSFLEIRKYAFAAFVKAAPGIGQIENAGCAAQQLHPETLFEARHPATDGRLGDLKAIGRGGKAARVHDSDKSLNIFESIHIVAIIGTILSSKHCLSLLCQQTNCAPT